MAAEGRLQNWAKDAALAALALGIGIGVIAAYQTPTPGLQLKPALAAAPAKPEAPPPFLAFGEPAPGHPVISPFGLRKLPWEEHGRLHAGVDIAAPQGTPVRAAADGVVTRAGQDGGYGRFVEVAHASGLKSLYAHLGAIGEGVAPGAAVKLGQAVGKMGSTGTSTGSHLHFEVRDERDRPLDPTRFIGRQFADAEDVPLTSARRYRGSVRVAYVSYIPRSKRELMKAREAEKAMKTQPRLDLDSLQTSLKDGRPFARIAAAGSASSTPSALTPKGSALAAASPAAYQAARAAAIAAAPPPTPAPRTPAAESFAAPAVETAAPEPATLATQSPS